jgi:hypothetical protein
MTTARIPFFFPSEEMRTTRGRPKARVLPEPVSAMPTTSRLERRCGQAADCMEVGLGKEVKREENCEEMDEGRWEKDRMGRREVDWGSVIWTDSSL